MKRDQKPLGGDLGASAVEQRENLESPPAAKFEGFRAPTAAVCKIARCLFGDEWVSGMQAMTLVTRRTLQRMKAADEEGREHEAGAYTLSVTIQVLADVNTILQELSDERRS